MATGIMMFTAPSGVHAGDVQGTVDRDKISVTYAYTINKKTYKGSFVTETSDGERYAGKWQETDDTNSSFSGTATLTRLIDGKQCILYGTWAQTTPPTFEGRWTLDLDVP
jgi:hypothetical protein